MAPIGLKHKRELTPEPVPVCLVRCRPASVGFHLFLTFSGPRLTFLSVLGRRFRPTVLLRFLQSALSLRKRVVSLRSLLVRSAFDVLSAWIRQGSLLPVGRRSQLVSVAILGGFGNVRTVRMVIMTVRR
jgi:hypothetical protein